MNPSAPSFSFSYTPDSKSNDRNKDGKWTLHFIFQIYNQISLKEMSTLEIFFHSETDSTPLTLKQMVNLIRGRDDEDDEDYPDYASEPCRCAACCY